MSYPPPIWTVYNAPSKRFFATDPYLGHLNVIDDVERRLVTTLVIPGAFGIDQAPDGSVLYIGTLQGDLFFVDPVRLIVIRHYPTRKISAFGFPAQAVYALANGKLLLETYFLEEGYSWVDGNGPLALWDPKDNSIVEFAIPSANNAGMTLAKTCAQTFQNAVLSRDRTHIYLIPTLTQPTELRICSFDPNSATWQWSSVRDVPSDTYVADIGETFDGKYMVYFDGYSIRVNDAQTLKLVRTIPVKHEPFQTNLFVRGYYAYLTSGTGAIVTVYDVITGKAVGWIPNIQMNTGETSPTPWYQAIDPSGLAAGVLYQGIGLLDISHFNSLPANSQFSNVNIAIPYGPLGGGTETSWLESILELSGPLPLKSVYFGENLAADISVESSDSGNTIEATSPPGLPGPVDITALTSDGGMQFLPEAFSYGPWVQEEVTRYAPAEGGATAQIYGYGFGPFVEEETGEGYLAPPPDLKVAIGGNTAKVLGYEPDPYSLSGEGSAGQPFPTQGVQFVVPPGKAGTTVPLEVKNSAGEITARTGFTYLPAIASFPVLGGRLIDGIYDPHREVYYFTDANQVRIFSLKRKAWLPPIRIPSPKGAAGPQRLWAIALSPDGSKLAVSDYGAVAIYLIDPDHPADIKSFAYAHENYISQYYVPTGVAVDNNGFVVFAISDTDGDGGAPYLYRLNPYTGFIAACAQFGADIGIQNAPYGRLIMNSAGDRAYFDNAGLVGYVNPAYGAPVVPYRTVYLLGADDYEFALAPNGTAAFGDGFMFDADLNTTGIEVLNWRESFDAEYVYGAAFSSDGKLFYQPGPHSIDVFDGSTGVFKARVALPIQLSENYRALIPDGTDNVLIGITGTDGNGIAIIDLTGIL